MCVGAGWWWCWSLLNCLRKVVPGFRGLGPEAPCQPHHLSRDGGAIDELGTVTPTSTPCLSVDPRSVRKGALSPPLSCLTLEDAPLWTWLPSSLKKKQSRTSVFRLLAGVGLGPDCLGSNPSPAYSPCVTLRQWQNLACPLVSRALPEVVTLLNASHMVAAQRIQCGCVEPRHVPA